MSNSKVLRVGGVPEHFNLPWHLAREKGRFAEAGLNVQYTDFPGGTGAMTRGLRDGVIDIALVLSEGAVTNVLRGNPLRIVKVYVESPLIWGIHVAANSRFENIDDIRGARYAISRQGSGSHLIAIVDAAERGWNTDEMEFVRVGGIEGAREALADGEADVFLWERFMTQSIVDLGEFRRIGERRVPWPAFVVAGNEPVVEDREDEIRQVLSIIDKECAGLMQNPNAIELISQRYDLDESETQIWFDHVCWHAGFDCPTEDLDRVIKYLERVGIVETNGAKASSVWRDLKSGVDQSKS